MSGIGNRESERLYEKCASGPDSMNDFMNDLMNDFMNDFMLGEAIQRSVKR